MVVCRHCGVEIELHPRIPYHWWHAPADKPGFHYNFCDVTDEDRVELLAEPAAAD
jgi:hypothetical protein